MQIFAFFLNSLSTEAPTQVQNNTAMTLDTQAIEYIDILKRIPETKQKELYKTSYKAAYQKGFFRSPIRIQSYRAAVYKKPVGNQVPESSSDDDNNTPPIPTPKWFTAGQNRNQGQLVSSRYFTKGQKNENWPVKKKAALLLRIKDRLFCTQQCLLGLANSGDLDNRYPNLRDYQERYILPNTFLALICTQLTSDYRYSTDCKLLYIKGSCRALFKVRLSLYRYILVVKGMEKAEYKYLIHKSKVYEYLWSIQGSCILVSLGIVNLELPYYYDTSIYFSILFLSQAGRSLYQYLTLKNEAYILDQVNMTLGELHRQQVLHKDIELRNQLQDEQYSRLMLIDFECTAIY